MHLKTAVLSLTRETLFKIGIICWSQIKMKNENEKTKLIYLHQSVE